MIIQLQHVYKTYKKNFKTICALHDINLEVKPNCILGILGPNGAGKTTLLKIITGITTADKNSSGVTLFNSSTLDNMKHRLGFLPENPEFFKNISAFELLAFSQKISGQPEDKNSILNLLKQVNLFHERNERVKTFSKGMRQRMGIAQAIIHQPELLILDEPMSGLDPQGRRLVMDLIDNYFKQGKTILFSTHNLDDIEALCTDVLVINQGKILMEKSLTELRKKSSYKIERETAEGKHTLLAQNQEELWDILKTTREQNGSILRIQSGIAEQLEIFFNEENPDGVKRNQAEEL